MKKFVFALAVLLLAAPTWAVDVECTADGCDVTVSFSGASTGPVRGMAFDIQLSGDGTISNVQCLSAAYGYQIFPGSISIDSSGNVDDPGSCKCSGSYAGTYDDANAMTIEMASLYEDTVDPDPCDAGDLVSFRVAGTGTIDVSISVNTIRGGVVNEDASVGSASITDCNVVFAPTECMKNTHPDYTTWGLRGSPDCWCYHKQCKGDINGTAEGPFSVSLADLNILRPCFNQMSPGPGCECADLDHAAEGPFIVSLNDLNILRPNFNQMSVSDCDGTHINFWTN